MPIPANAGNRAPGGGYAAGQAGSFQGDPAMLQMQASVNQALAFAEQEAMREMRQLLIDYGDPELTAKYLNEPTTGSEYWEIAPDYGTGQRGRPNPNRPFNPNQGVYLNPLVRNEWGTFDYDIGQAKANQAYASYPKTNVKPPFVSPHYGTEADALRAMGMAGLRGSAEFRRSGKGVNVLAAENNPYSILKQLARQATNEMSSANENLNQSNLWYSSERGRVLGELGTNDQQRRYEAAQAVQQQLNSIQAQLTQAQLDAQGQLAQQTLQSQQDRNQKILQQGR